MTPKKRVIPVFIPHLGCPNDCVFCNQRKISGKKQPATAQTVTEAVSEASGAVKSEPAELAFYGGSFTAIPVNEQVELLQAAQDFLKLNGENRLRLSTRPDCIDENTVARLKKYNVETVELGAQSMCDDVLLESGRGHTANDTELAAKMLKSAGFKLILQMMTGLPGDTAEKSIYTAERLIELKPDGVRIYPAVIIKDTQLYSMWKDGKYKEHTAEEAAELCARLCGMFFKAGIPVIRLGLNPTDELSGGEAAGGAYHPAFGEIVYSKMYLAKAREMLKRASAYNALGVRLGVNGSCVSVMTGQHRCNIEALEREFGIGAVKVCRADIARGDIKLLDIEKNGK